MHSEFVQKNIFEKICIFFKKGVDKSRTLCYNTEADERKQQNLGVAQLVARYLGVVEAASSSLVTQTKSAR